MNPHRRCCNKYVGTLNPRQSQRTAVKATSRAPTPDKTNVYFIACFTCKRRGARDRKAAHTKAPRRRTPTGRRLCGGPAASVGERSTSSQVASFSARGWRSSTCCRAASSRPHWWHKSSKKFSPHRRSDGGRRQQASPPSARRAAHRPSGRTTRRRPFRYLLTR